MQRALEDLRASAARDLTTCPRDARRLLPECLTKLAHVGTGNVNDHLAAEELAEQPDGVGELLDGRLGLRATCSSVTFAAC